MPPRGRSLATLLFEVTTPASAKGEVCPNHQANNFNLERLVMVKAPREDDRLPPTWIVGTRPQFDVVGLQRDLLDGSLAQMTAVSSSFYDDEVSFSRRVAHLDRIYDVGI